MARPLILYAPRSRRSRSHSDSREEEILDMESIPQTDLTVRPISSYISSFQGAGDGATPSADISTPGPPNSSNRPHEHAGDATCGRH
jgi:hypothetical protein